jgi:hypothetical protein
MTVDAIEMTGRGGCRDSLDVVAECVSGSPTSSSSGSDTRLINCQPVCVTTGDALRWLRQPARFVRLRPDRLADDCGLEQSPAQPGELSARK